MHSPDRPGNNPIKRFPIQIWVVHHSGNIQYSFQQREFFDISPPLGNHNGTIKKV